jgi:glutaredoxin
MFYLSEADFDENLDCLKNYNLIVGFSNGCPQCKKLAYLLEYRQINFACIDIEKNTIFLKNLKVKLKSESLGLPIMLVYKDNKFKKMMNTTMNIVEITQAINN